MSNTDHPGLIKPGIDNLFPVLTRDEVVRLVLGDTLGIDGGRHTAPCFMEHSKHTFAAWVDDSIADPKLGDHGVAFVDQERESHEGDLVMLVLAPNGEIQRPTFRKLQHDDIGWVTMFHSGELGERIALVDELDDFATGSGQAIESDPGVTPACVIGPVLIIGALV